MRRKQESLTKWNSIYFGLFDKIVQVSVTSLTYDPNLNNYQNDFSVHFLAEPVRHDPDGQGLKRVEHAQQEAPQDLSDDQKLHFYLFIIK